MTTPPLAYSEIHTDEKAATCTAFLHRAAAFFTRHDITRIERILRRQRPALPQEPRLEKRPDPT